MTILLTIVALFGYALFYLPVYLPFLLSFLFRGASRRELRIALRLAPVLAIMILLARPRAPRPNFGDDVAGNMRGSQHYFDHEFWPHVAWTWGAGFLCFFAALTLGHYLCRRRSVALSRHP